MLPAPPPPPAAIAPPVVVVQVVVAPVEVIGLEDAAADIPLFERGMRTSSTSGGFCVVQAGGEAHARDAAGERMRNAPNDARGELRWEALGGEDDLAAVEAVGRHDGQRGRPTSAEDASPAAPAGAVFLTVQEV